MQENVDRFVVGSFHKEVFEFLCKEVSGVNGDTRLKFLNGEQYQYRKRVRLFRPRPLNMNIRPIDPIIPGDTLTLDFFEFGYYNNFYWVAYDKQENVLYEYV